MKSQHIVDELKRVAQHLGIQVRLDKGRFQGGYCKLGGEYLIVLNKNHLPETHLSVLANCLRDQPTESVFMRPAVRRVLEELWQRHEQTEPLEVGIDIY